MMALIKVCLEAIASAYSAMKPRNVEGIFKLKNDIKKYLIFLLIHLNRFYLGRDQNRVLLHYSIGIKATVPTVPHDMQYLSIVLSY